MDVALAEIVAQALADAEAAGIARGMKESLDRFRYFTALEPVSADVRPRSRSVCGGIFDPDRVAARRLFGLALQALSLNPRRRDEGREEVNARCRIPTCTADAEWIAETPVGETPLCDSHYESLIASAQKNNPQMPPEMVRSCMERASYPIAVKP